MSKQTKSAKSKNDDVFPLWLLAMTVGIIISPCIILALEFWK